MFNLQESLEKRLLELKKKPATEEMKKDIKLRLIRAGILNKDGKLKELHIK